MARSIEEEQAIRHEEEPRSLLPVASVKPSPDLPALPGVTGTTPNAARLSTASVSSSTIAESLGLVAAPAILLPSELLLETHNNIILLYPYFERWVAAVGQLHITNYRVVFSGRLTRQPGNVTRAISSIASQGPAAKGPSQLLESSARIRRVPELSADAVQLGVSPDADEADEVEFSAAAGESSSEGEDDRGACPPPPMDTGSSGASDDTVRCLLDCGEPCACNVSGP